ncbi:M20 family metallo-hydrolase [Terrilactibacillus laevilacticus]|uniref:M20 family metallo-hydrolase n=1 Tax=Terrilactibacillus laevilacticus TaxID=1380157 RepID=A0ABW5PRH6_9BACI|nr:M20 family metallo-hydrolase [Terrilactibacillus laevilacticus]
MISINRIMERIELLSKISEPTEQGVSRVALTKEYKQAIDVVSTWMQEAGMSTRLDNAGNLIGFRKGSDETLAPVALGSHIDSVREGGKYDGIIGVIGGIEVAQHLFEENINIKRGIEVIAFCEEEGSRFQSGGVFGSRAMVGKLKEKDLEVTDEQGITRREALKNFGLDADHIEQAIREKGDLSLYLEMHIEQGPLLFSKNVPVGIVTGITGLSLIDITFKGEANHVGATPMNMRNDALLGASEVALQVEKITNRFGEFAVGTVSTLELLPGQVNIVPGEVKIVIDVRDLDEQRRDGILEEIELATQNVCQKRGLAYEINTRMKVKPALSAPHVLDQMLNDAEKLGIQTIKMPSGGGHDAQLMNEITDIGMVFVRSENGSHNPDEYAAPTDIEKGTQLLSEVTIHYLCD